MRWTRRVPAFVEATGRAAIGSSDAHRAEDVGQAVTLFAGRTAEDLREAILARSTSWDGRFYPWRAQLTMFRAQMGKNARAVADELAGKVARRGTGRDLGYPGGRLRPPRLVLDDEQAGDG
jgi:hypothetical protein